LLSGAHTDDATAAARYALGKTNAIFFCPQHLSIAIRTGDANAEYHAYLLATILPKSNGTIWKRDELFLAIKRELGVAAVGECPICAHPRNT
jgi:hypothetical protein